MIILIGNQKGGPGKSTITLLLANYLSQSQTSKVTVIDMDYQQSIAQLYQKAKVLENIPPYEVIAASLEQYNRIKPVLCENPKQIVIIDLPGKLDDDGLIPVFLSADLVLCPFSYDEFSFDSTILFSVVLHKIKPDVELTFIPNRVKANVKYQTKIDVDLQLGRFGTVTAPIPDRVDFQRTNTFCTPMSVAPLVAPLFQKIYEDHFSFFLGDLIPTTNN